MTTRIIAVSNQKGGTGKSTTAVNLAAGLARGVANGKRVLLVDVDPQANATATFFGARYVAGPKPGLTVHDVLMGRAQTGQAVRQAQLATNTRHGIPGATLDVLPSHVTLAAAELELVSAFQRESWLREALEPIQDGYHYVVVDCPPSLGLLTVNALMAATEVLVPVDPGFYIAPSHCATTWAAPCAALAWTPGSGNASSP